MQEKNTDISRWRFEPPRVDTLQLGENLPVEYRTLIKEINSPLIPDSFKQQAMRAVYYFYALETNQILTDTRGIKIETAMFADELSSLPLVSLLYVQFSNQFVKPNVPTAIHSTRPFSLGDPEKSFPAWLRSAYKNRSKVAVEAPTFNVFYDMYIQTHAEKSLTRPQGIYSQYSPDVCPEKSDTVDANFKGYLEFDAKDSALEAAFESLRQLKLHPHETKLFEGDRLVLYWFTTPSPELLDDIKKVFRTQNVPFRGPGEDSLYVVKDSSGLVKVETRASNDQALGEGGKGVKFAQDEYSPIQFIKNYLEQCYRFWRNPLNPYQTSFIPAFDLSGGNVDDLLSEQRRVFKTLVPMEKWMLVLFQTR